MGKAAEPMIKDFSGKDFTCITFKPDLAKFKMETLDSDTVALLTRRAYDVAGSVRGIAVYLNEKKLPVCSIKGFVLTNVLANLFANTKRWFLFSFMSQEFSNYQNVTFS